MKKVLFISRDNALLQDLPLDCRLDSVEKMEFYPQVFKYLTHIVQELNYELVMIVDYATGTFFLPEKNLRLMQKEIEQVLQRKGIVFSNIITNTRFYERNQFLQVAPHTIFARYLKGNYDMANSYIISNSKLGPSLAQVIGCKAIHISENHLPNTVLNTVSWKQIYRFLSSN